MDNPKRGKDKKNVFSKTWERCKSINKDREKSPTFSKSKSWNFTKPTTSSKGNKIAPGGCFAVYVGPQKQRFVIKTKFANHPLFKMLLEDAEMEYGHNCEGPIMLPCDVDLFYKVLAEMDSKDENIVPSCGFAYGSCSPFNPSRRLSHGDMGGGYGSYGFLTPSRLLKMNNF